METDYSANIQLESNQMEIDNSDNIQLESNPLNSEPENDEINENQQENDQLKNAYSNTEDNNLEENGELDDSNSKDSLKATDGTDELSNEEEGEDSDNQEDPIAKDSSHITVESKSVVKERYLILHLLDSENKGIANKELAISIAKKTFTETTDENGQVSLKISLDTGEYTVDVKFAGDENYTESNRTFEMKVYKLKTKFTVKYTSIIRGKYFYAYLKDKNGDALASKYVTIKYRNKIYHKKTNKNGRIRLKINAKPGKYTIKLIYKGSKTYKKTTKKLSIISYRAKTRITLDNKYVIKNKYLHINLKYGNNKALANKKITIILKNKVYKRTTDKDGKAYLKLNKPIREYRLKVRFNGAKGYLKSSISTKIRVVKNYKVISAKTNKTTSLLYEKTLKYYMRITDKKGNPLAGKNVTVKVKCNNFTIGSGIKITKKTIVLSSDNIDGKAKDKRRLRQMAKLLRAKGYKVIISGIGPNYHVSDVKKYKNVCVYSLVGGIDSGMFVDMSHSYYQHYLKKNKNQFVLGCVDPPKGINLANRIWLKRAHDDNYSPRKFKGLYFPGKYLNKRTHVDYVYGSTPKQLVSNFMKYGRHGKSIGLHNTLPGRYKTYKLTTSEKGYVHIDLPLGNHTVIYSYAHKDNTVTSVRNWVNIVK